MYRPNSDQSTLKFWRYMHYRNRLSGFHRMTLAAMKKGFKNFQPRIQNYRSYKHFSNGAYMESLINKLPQENFVNEAVLKDSVT